MVPHPNSSAVLEHQSRLATPTLRAPRSAHQVSGVEARKYDPSTGASRSGANIFAITKSGRIFRSAIQHAGPKLSGYASTGTITTVAQNAMPGFLRSVM